VIDETRPERKLVSIIQPKTTDTDNSTQEKKTYLLVGDHKDIESIKYILEDKDITCQYLKATQICDQIMQHRKKEFQVLIMNSNEFGKGLDLTYIDEIITYCPLQAEMHEQVTGRLCRLGRTQKIIVHKFEYREI
jgi:hypothetical protein